MSWRIAESLLKLRKQLNAAYPNRSRVSDGGIGDASHASRSSDHNPWVKDSHGGGVVTAIDITHDLQVLDCNRLAETLLESRDSRIKYIIWNRQIASKAKGWKWRKYTGVNAHRHHLHISVESDAAHYDSIKDWDLDIATSQVPVGHFADLDESEIEFDTPPNHIAVEPVRIQRPQPQDDDDDLPPTATVTQPEPEQQTLTESTEVKTIPTPEPVGFRAKLTKIFGAITGGTFSLAALKEYFNIPISPETLGLLKLILPVILVLVGVGVLIWFVAEKITHWKVFQLTAQINSDKSRDDIEVGK